MVVSPRARKIIPLRVDNIAKYFWGLLSCFELFHQQIVCQLNYNLYNAFSHTHLFEVVMCEQNQDFHESNQVQRREKYLDLSHIKFNYYENWKLIFTRFRLYQSLKNWQHKKRLLSDKFSSYDWISIKKFHLNFMTTFISSLPVTIFPRCCIKCDRSSFLTNFFVMVYCLSFPIGYNLSHLCL